MLQIVYTFKSYKGNTIYVRIDSNNTLIHVLTNLLKHLVKFNVNIKGNCI